MFTWIDIIYATYSEVRKMATKVSELAAELANVKALLSEASIELLGKIIALEEALGSAGDLPPDVTVALEEVRVSAQALADVVPNEPPVEPPVEDPVV